MTNYNDLIDLGRQLELYEESEKTDEGSNDLDALWQSIYDVYHLVIVGIIEGEIDDVAMIEAKEWLLNSQGSTKEYQSFEV